MGFVNSNILMISLDSDKVCRDLARRLRDRGIGCSVFYGKVGKGLEYANSKEFAKVIIIGKEEVKSKKFTLKDLKSGKEKSLNVNDLIKVLV